MLPLPRLVRLSLLLAILSLASAGAALQATLKLGSSLDDYYEMQSSAGALATVAAGEGEEDLTGSGEALEEQSSLVGTLQPLE